MNKYTFSSLLAITLSAQLADAAPQVTDVSPARQRVHEHLRIHGSGFGTFEPGVSRVLFRRAGAEGPAAPVHTPYVWRDDFIEIRVPVGGPGGPIGSGALELEVVTAAGSSPRVNVEILGGAGAALDFIEKTRISNDLDASGYLGGPGANIARTKDGEIGDVNGDGLPDLIDNNSSNQSNNTHSVLRLNRGGLFFAAANWEPITPGDSGPFVVTVLPGGAFVGDAVAYDADLVDLDNDGLPDWVQAASGSLIAVRVARNNYQGVPGRFVEDTAGWFPAPSFPNGSPDDLAHADVNLDGFVDVAAAFRFSNRAQVYLNDAGQSFASTVEIISVPGASIHDVVFLEANADGFPDVVAVNESGVSVVFVHDGNLAAPGFTPAAALPLSAFAGTAADFNADGLDDIALSGSDGSSVFLNDPSAPGSFTEIALPDPVVNLYDLEAGDIDLDGDVDLVGVSIVTNADDNVRIWLNDGSGNFTNATSPGALAVLPGNAPYQRLSAELIDADLDGDLDLYLTGADGVGAIGFGQVANQYWENRIRGFSLDVLGTCPGNAALRGKGATPAGQVMLLGSTTRGLTTLAVPAPCADTRIGLRGAMPLALVTADANGSFNIARPLSAAFCGRFVEALDLTSCEATSIDRLP